MSKPVKILLQTTIPYAEDDWHIGRFSLLNEHLKSLLDENGNALYDVTTRNREENLSGVDPLLSTLDESDFDQLWLFALDLGEGLTPMQIAGAALVMAGLMVNVFGGWIVARLAAAR